MMSRLKFGGVDVALTKTIHYCPTFALCVNAASSCWRSTSGNSAARDQSSLANLTGFEAPHRCTANSRAAALPDCVSPIRTVYPRPYAQR
jgi:hypothetical protein